MMRSRLDMPRSSGNTPDNIFLEFVDVPIGKRDSPHHFDNLEPTVFVERALEDIGEMIKVDGFVITAFGCRNQPRRRSVVEAKVALDDLFQADFLGPVDYTIRFGEMDEQSDRRETVVVLTEFPLRRGAGKLRQKTSEFIEHCCVPSGIRDCDKEGVAGAPEGVFAQSRRSEFLGRAGPRHHESRRSVR